MSNEIITNLGDSTQNNIRLANGSTNSLMSMQSGKPDWIDTNTVIVTQENVATTLGGTIDSTKAYAIDSIIDLGTTEITIPSTGISIVGLTFDISGLVSSENNHTMFKSVGCGNVLMKDLHLITSGTGSKLFDLVDDNGFHALEFARVNFNDCTSMGVLDNFRQGLENGTGRFGGTPNLTLKGTWLGGYRITTSIVRSLDAGMTGALFQEGTAFSMASRFLTDINCDLPTSASLVDFQASNFPNPSTLQFYDTIISRNGTIDPEDVNLTPNVDETDLISSWRNNQGLHNTFVGAESECTVEVETVITTQGVSEVLLGTQVATDLQHFDSPVNGQLRHLGTSPAEFSVSWDFIIDGQPNGELKIELIEDGGGGEVVIHSQTRVVNNLQGGRDVAFFSGTHHERILQNDITYWKVTNLTGTQNCTLELGSTWDVDER